VHNLLAITGRIMYTFMNYGRQWVQDISIFCIASVLLLHIESSLLVHVRLAIILLSILIQ